MTQLLPYAEIEIDKNASLENRLQQQMMLKLVNL